MVNSCNSLEQQLEYHLKIDVHLNFNCLSWRRLRIINLKEHTWQMTTMKTRIIAVLQQKKINKAWSCIKSTNDLFDCIGSTLPNVKSLKCNYTQLEFNDYYNTIVDVKKLKQLDSFVALARNLHSMYSSYELKQWSTSGRRRRKGT